MASRSATGSSPRMRGARLLIDSKTLLNGIIPAYAGSTQRHTHIYHRHPDHPRVCGEHCFRSKQSKTGRGSSPRMRGAQTRIVAVQVVARIIPAYAGSTSRTPASRSHPRDHPRVCGEHLLHKPMHTDLPGSSPRMRGAPIIGELHLIGNGIIPAYAGSTPAYDAATCEFKDHPRVCGEHAKAFGRFAC